MLEFISYTSCKWPMKYWNLLEFYLLKPSDYYMYNQLQHPQILRSAHNAFKCFLCVSEQTAIISLYSIDWLVFITEAESVHSAVRTDSLCVFCVYQNKQRLFLYTALTDWFL